MTGLFSLLLSTPNVKDETRAGERADDLNLGKCGAEPGHAN